MAALVCALVWGALASVATGRDLFDEIYERGKGIDQSLKTLTARFVETSTSPLLDRPLVARGTLAVVRPTRVILRYQEPDVRTVLIDGDRLTLDWPARQLRQQSNIGAAQRRVQTYFVGKSPDDLRKHFKIGATTLSDRPNYLVTLDPTRKQIRESLTLLELWINRETLLLDAMQMHFVGGETKKMEFSEIVVNPPLDATTFAIGAK
jgi:outer membrane lipoprotein-sorting protein